MFLLHSAQFGQDVVGRSHTVKIENHKIAHRMFLFLRSTITKGYANQPVANQDKP
jgi:hypothetical protein